MKAFFLITFAILAFSTSNSEFLRTLVTTFADTQMDKAYCSTVAGIASLTFKIPLTGTATVAGTASAVKLTTGTAANDLTYSCGTVPTTANPTLNCPATANPGTAVAGKYTIKSVVLEPDTDKVTLAASQTKFLTLYTYSVKANQAAQTVDYKDTTSSFNIVFDAEIKEVPAITATAGTTTKSITGCTITGTGKDTASCTVTKDTLPAGASGAALEYTVSVADPCGTALANTLKVTAKNSSSTGSSSFISFSIISMAIIALLF